MSNKPQQEGTRRAGEEPKTAKHKPANEIFSAAIAAGIEAYDRSRDLPRLLAVWPCEVEDSSENARLDVLEKLRRALRTQKRQADAGH